MSEHSTTSTQSPDGVIGLATGLGALRSDLNHHIEDQIRAFDELRSAQGEQFATLEDAVNNLETRLTELASILNEAVTAMQAYASRNGGTPATSTPRNERTSPPTRNARENNKSLYTRLVKWAEERGVDAPPKPKGTEFPNAYDTRLQAWEQGI